MRVSIIVAGHNEGDRLWRTIQSCVETTADLDCEILVADDNSTDDSVEQLLARFPRIQVVRHETTKVRLGPSPTKDLGARRARGEVLVFLDGHCKPEPGAILRLVEGVETLDGQAIIIPTVPHLDVESWSLVRSRVGHAYAMDLETFQVHWVGLDRMNEVSHRGRTFYEAPGLTGSSFAMTRRLYEQLRGFDPHMFDYGLEDLDLGFKSWLMGHSILHDPVALVGHRFRAQFDNYNVAMPHIVANQLRMARKNFGETTWAQWVSKARVRNAAYVPPPLSEHQEGLWAQAWLLFDKHRASVEEERAYLLGRRKHDEFWYAEKFGLDWPRFGPEDSSQKVTHVLAQASPSPSPAPCPETAHFWQERDPLITGWSTDPNHFVSYTFGVQVHPHDGVDDIDFEIDGVDRIDLDVLSRNKDTGRIQVRIVGNSETPASVPDGDTVLKIVCKSSRQVYASRRVVVEVPKKVVLQSETSVPSPQNILLNTMTSPAAPISPPNVLLGTFYGFWWDVQVHNQFGTPLNRVYSGSPVDEVINGGPQTSINQRLTNNGTYSDPVGGLVPGSTVLDSSTAAQNWPTNPPLSLSPASLTAAITVYVAGHQLNTFTQGVDTQLLGFPPGTVRVRRY